MKVMTFIGTRPEIIKLSRVIPMLDANVEHILVHTGQNYDHQLSDVFFEEMSIRKPDEQLHCSGSSAVGTISSVLVAADLMLEKHKPDAVLILGDTNSAYAALAAKRRKIPIFHMEAGNRCFDERTPEEINRKVIDHISDINMPYTEHARRNLLAEGIAPDRIVKTGSPMQEVCNYYADNVRESSILDLLKLTPKRYYVVSVHREENVDDPKKLYLLSKVLVQLTNHGEYPVVVTVHPRTLARMQASPSFMGSVPNGVHLAYPFGFFDYAQLQKNARCVLSDSGTLTEEACLWNFPAVMLRESHERPEGTEAGATIMSGLHPSKVMPAVRIADSARREYNLFKLPADYRSRECSRVVLHTILSYTDYVNRVVWRR